MDNTLLTPVEVLPADADLAPVVVRLVAERDPLRAEMAQLRRDHLELRQQAGYWHSRHADAVRRLATAQPKLCRGRRADSEEFLPWNLSEERRAQLCLARSEQKTDTR
jgi:hypothetical protein